MKDPPLVLVADYACERTSMPREIPLTDRQNLDILSYNEVITVKNQNFSYYLKRFLSPVVLILLGLILTFSPDSATTLLVQIIGWVLITVAAGLFAAAVALPGSMAGKVIGCLLCGASGLYMVLNPLHLAAWFGRIVGILLLLQGIQNILYQRLRTGSLFLPVLTAVVGAVLLVLPMATSRIVFTVAGIVVLLIGILMLVDRLRHPAGPGEPENPNIIDAL